MAKSKEKASHLLSRRTACDLGSNRTAILVGIAIAFVVVRVIVIVIFIIVALVLARE